MEVLSYLRDKLERVEQQLLAIASEQKSRIESLHLSQQAAALNLIQYLCLRSEDIRDLQDQLHINGLSSLASSESHILSQVQAILQRLGKDYPAAQTSTCTYMFSRQSIAQRSEQLFGARTDAGIPRIMITFDKDFTEDYPLVKDLLLHGMNIARINCAHDDEDSWEAMVRIIRKASAETGRSCKVYMDLAGPKIRTVLMGKGKKKGKVKISEGDLILLAEEKAEYSKKDVVVGVAVPDIISQLKEGHRILFDDGIIEAVVERPGKDLAQLRIMRIFTKKHFLKPGKGINLPDSSIAPMTLTDYDRECLPFICKNADIIGYSFVETERQLALLQEMLANTGPKPPFIILKIERAEAVRNLPALLLQAMRQETFGIMIARGDLAVEIGFERLSEIQEEILWIAEAAHVPVVWATQVLDNLNKTGLATRSEITDAVYSGQAECVMINKGDFIIEVMDTLKNILQRSGEHHIKKRYVFRPLHIARNFFHLS
jgi:pyruvate kinase